MARIPFDIETIPSQDPNILIELPGKAGMDGSKVYGAWLAGEHKKISEYNVDDIIAVRNIDRRLLTAGGYKHD